MSKECYRCRAEISDNMWHCLECQNTETFNDIVTEKFNISVFSYNSKVTDDFFNVLEAVAEGLYCTEIAQKYDMSPSHVELIQYLLCNNGHADYGTSPRGCWLTDSGKAVYEELKTLR